MERGRQQNDSTLAVQVTRTWCTTGATRRRRRTGCGTTRSPPATTRPATTRCASCTAAAATAAGETAILPTLSLHPYWSACRRERGVQQSDRPLARRRRRQAAPWWVVCGVGRRDSLDQARPRLGGARARTQLVFCCTPLYLQQVFQQGWRESVSKMTVSPMANRWRDCHSAAPPSPFSRCLNRGWRERVSTMTASAMARLERH